MLREYGVLKIFYNCWKWWSDKGVFVWMMDGLVVEVVVLKMVMIDVIYFKVYCMVISLWLKKGGQVIRGVV